MLEFRRLASDVGFYGRPPTALQSSAACPPNLCLHQKGKQPRGLSHAEQGRGSATGIEYRVPFEEVI